MNPEYVIINKTELEAELAETRIVALELDAAERHIKITKDWEWNHLVNSTKQKLYKKLLSKSTPLIPEIENAFNAGGAYTLGSHKEFTQTYPSKQDYITNLKLDI